MNTPGQSGALRAPGDIWDWPEAVIVGMASGLARLIAATEGHRRDLAHLSESRGDVLAEGPDRGLCVDHGVPDGRSAEEAA